MTSELQHVSRFDRAEDVHGRARLNQDHADGEEDAVGLARRRSSSTEVQVHGRVEDELHEAVGQAPEGQVVELSSDFVTKCAAR